MGHVSKGMIRTRRSVKKGFKSIWLVFLDYRTVPHLLWLSEVPLLYSITTIIVLTDISERRPF